MDDHEAALRQMLERQAIEEVLLRYASTIDYKDYATLRTLFCDDIRGQYGDVVVVIVAACRGDQRQRGSDGTGLSRPSATQHSLSPLCMSPQCGRTAG